jgi:hypothetical protein
MGQYWEAKMVQKMALMTELTKAHMKELQLAQ